MAVRVIRQIGAPKSDAPGHWELKALVVSGKRQAWVLASGPSHAEAQKRLDELIEAQDKTWMVRDEQ